MIFNENSIRYIARRSHIDYKYIKEYFKDVDSRESLLAAFNKMYDETYGKPQYLKPERKVKYVKGDEIMNRRVPNVKNKNKVRGDIPLDRPLVNKYQQECEKTSESKGPSYKTKFIADNVDFPKTDIVYLDHGCGSGKITEELSKLMNAKKIYGIDIYEHPLLAERGIISIMPESSGKIDLPDSSVDVITCLLSMHHVMKQEETAKELVRILKPNGILILYEHDIKPDDTETRDFLDLVHLSFVFYGQENEKEGDEKIVTPVTMDDIQWIFDAKYHTKTYWRELFDGLTLIKEFSVPNRQNMYFEVFAKK